MFLALAVWAWLGTQQLGPPIPPLEIHYLGPSKPGVAPDDIEALSEVAPERATAILFKGGFLFGGTAAVTAALDAAPGVKTVAFDSPGGRIAVGIGVAMLISHRHLATAVTGYCASACTVAYVAGQPRLAARAAKFRFHLGTAPFLANFAGQATVTLEQPWFVRGGVSLGFANRALHAPNERPYAPRLDELVAAGYVQTVLPPFKDGGPETGLAALQPLLNAVGALEPNTRRALVWEHDNRIADGMAVSDSANFVELWAGLVVNRWLGRSSDAAALGLIDAMFAIMDTTGAIEPTGCMRWQVGVTRQMAGFAAIPPELRERLNQAQLAVLHDARLHPNPVPDDRDALMQADQAVRHDVLSQFGARALIIAATPEHAFDDPAKSCAAEAAYLRGLRNRPEGGRLVRWALAAG